MDVSDDYPGYAECGQDLRINIKKEDADRIVDCVNSCAGINPEAVPKMLEALYDAKDTIVQLLEMRGCQAEGDQDQWCSSLDIAIALAGKESE